MFCHVNIVKTWTYQCWRSRNAFNALVVHGGQAPRVSYPPQARQHHTDTWELVSGGHVLPQLTDSSSKYEHTFNAYILSTNTITLKLTIVIPSQLLFFVVPTSMTVKFGPLRLLGPIMWLKMIWVITIHSYRDRTLNILVQFDPQRKTSTDILGCFKIMISLSWISLIVDNFEANMSKACWLNLSVSYAGWLKKAMNAEYTSSFKKVRD